MKSNVKQLCNATEILRAPRAFKSWATILAEKGLTPLEIKKGLEIKNKQIEHLVCFDKAEKDVFQKVGTEGSVKLDANDKIKFVPEKDIHNHPDVGSDITSSKTFSATDLISFYASPNLKKRIVVSNKQVFILNKSQQDLNNPNLFEVLAESMNINERYKKAILQQFDAISLWRKKLDKLESLSEKDISGKVTDKKIFAKCCDLGDASYRLEDYIYSSAVRDIAKKNNWTYSQYKWDDILPRYVKEQS